MKAGDGSIQQRVFGQTLVGTGLKYCLRTGSSLFMFFVSTGADDDRDRGDPHQTFEARGKNITNRDIVN